jgi:hypothetical protein
MLRHPTVFKGIDPPPPVEQAETDSSNSARHNSVSGHVDSVKINVHLLPYCDAVL